MDSSNETAIISLGDKHLYSIMIICSRSEGFGFQLSTKFYSLQKSNFAENLIYRRHLMSVRPKNDTSGP